MIERVEDEFDDKNYEKTYESILKKFQFINKKVLLIKAVLVSILIIVAIFSAPILNSSEYTHFKHALEWNYFVGVILFYLFSRFFWRRTT